MKREHTGQYRVVCRTGRSQRRLVGESHRLSAPTAGKALESLEKLGIVREITGRRRSRVYVYGQYLDMLNKGTEPL